MPAIAKIEPTADIHVADGLPVQGAVRAAN